MGKAVVMHAFKTLYEKSQQSIMPCTNKECTMMVQQPLA